MPGRGSTELAPPVTPSRDVDDNEVVRALRDAHRAIHALLERALVGIELAPTEYRALAALARRGALTPTALSQVLEITPASTTGLVDRLESRRLVRRRPNPQDRRSMLIDVTPGGTELYLAARTVYRRTIGRVSGRMSAEGRTDLVRGVAEFLRVFGGPGSHSPDAPLRPGASRPAESKRRGA